jgi:hypothetical protein
VQQHLAERDALLIFDNCEHLLDAVGPLALMLADCEGEEQLPTFIPGHHVSVTGAAR